MPGFVWPTPFFSFLPQKSHQQRSNAGWSTDHHRCLYCIWKANAVQRGKKSVLVGAPLKRLGPVRRKGSRQIRSLPVCWRLLVLDKRHNQQPHLGREDVKTFCYMHHRPHHLLPRPAQCSVFCGIHFGIGIRPVHLQLNAAPSGCIGHCYALYVECQQMSSAWQTKRAEKPRRSHRRSCLHSLGCTLGVLLGCLHGCGTACA